MYAKKSNPVRFANVGEHINIDPSLSATPSQMDVLRRKGIPISTSVIADQYYDGNPPDKCSFDLSMTELRGVDIADLWQVSKSAKKKLSAAQQAAMASLDNPTTRV